MGSKFKKYSTKNTPDQYQMGGLNFDWLTNIQNKWRGAIRGNFQDPNDQQWVNGLLDRNTNLNTTYNQTQDKLLLPNQEFTQWGDEADKAYTGTIWDNKFGNNPDAPKWSSLSSAEQDDVWKNPKWNEWGDLKTKWGDLSFKELDKSGKLYDQDTATRKELGELNVQRGNQIVETGAGINALIQGQAAYDAKPKDRLTQSSGFGGFRRFQEGGSTNVGSNSILGAMGPTSVEKELIGEDTPQPIIARTNFTQDLSPDTLNNIIKQFNTDDTKVKMAAEYFSDLGVIPKKRYDKSSLNKEISKNAQKIAEVAKALANQRLDKTYVGANKTQGYKSGGNIANPIPTSNLGLYKYPNQVVNVPSNDITMKGINSPVLAIPNNNSPQLMYPNMDYKFPNSTNVLEIPMNKFKKYQRGGIVGRDVKSYKLPDVKTEKLAPKKSKLAEIGTIIERTEATTPTSTTKDTTPVTTPTPGTTPRVDNNSIPEKPIVSVDRKINGEALAKNVASVSTDRFSYEITDSKNKEPNRKSVRFKPVTLNPKNLTTQESNKFNIVNSKNEPKFKGEIDRLIKKHWGNRATEGIQIVGGVKVLNETDAIGGENKSYDPGARYLNNNGTYDAGIFQINEQTFEDFKNRKGSLLAKYGITSYDDLDEAEKNIIMGKIIFDEQGHNAYYGSPYTKTNQAKLKEKGVYPDSAGLYRINPLDKYKNGGIIKSEDEILLDYLTRNK